MTSTEVTGAAETAVARPLAVLVPLIKKDLEQGNEASKRAGEPYYSAVGEKLIEARPQVKQGDWGPWLKRHFNLSYTHAERYIKYAKATSNTSFQRVGEQAGSFAQFIRENTGDSTYGKRSYAKQPWHDDVKSNIERARSEAEQWRQAELTRQQERKAEQQLALRLIDIGFKVLAKELHPDRGGSRDAMARLNRVRDRLKQNT